MTDRTVLNESPLFAPPNLLRSTLSDHFQTIVVHTVMRPDPLHLQNLHELFWLQSLHFVDHRQSQEIRTAAGHAVLLHVDRMAFGAETRLA